MVEKVDCYQDFIDVVKTLDYKEKDKIEVVMYGAKSIVNAYENLRYKALCEYFFVKDNRTNKILATIALDRCGFLNFFVTKDLKPGNSLGFVKDLKNLAQKYVQKYGSLLVKTANFYKEAQKLNKVVGFKPYHLLDYYTIWVLKKEKETNG